jgi:hypothetical protein
MNAMGVRALTWIGNSRRTARFTNTRAWNIPNGKAPFDER